MYNALYLNPNMDVVIMGSKTKKQGNRQSAEDVFRYAQRAMEKQDFKEALKNAKVCFRQDPRRRFSLACGLGDLHVASRGCQPIEMYMPQVA